MHRRRELKIQRCSEDTFCECRVRASSCSDEINYLLHVSVRRHGVQVRIFNAVIDRKQQSRNERTITRTHDEAPETFPRSLVVRRRKLKFRAGNSLPRREANFHGSSHKKGGEKTGCIFTTERMRRKNGSTLNNHTKKHQKHAHRKRQE